MITNFYIEIVTGKDYITDVQDKLCIKHKSFLTYRIKTTKLNKNKYVTKICFLCLVYITQIKYTIYNFLIGFFFSFSVLEL